MKNRVKTIVANSSRVLLVAGFMALVVAILMVHVKNHHEITSLGYAISETTQQHRALMETNKKLSIEAAVIGRSDRVSSMASQRFGLAPRSPEQVRVVLNDSKEPQHASLGL